MIVIRRNVTGTHIRTHYTMYHVIQYDIHDEVFMTSVIFVCYYGGRGGGLDEMSRRVTFLLVIDSHTNTTLTSPSRA